MSLHKSAFIFKQVFRNNFCTAKLLNSFPSVEPVNLSYKLYTTTDVDNGVSPLIVMHGLFGSKKNWNSFCQKVQENITPRRKIIAIDGRNHGASPHSPYHTYPHMAQDIVQLLNNLNIQTVSILGHSMGGRVMMYLALAFPQLVDRAIIVDVSPVNSRSDFLDSLTALLQAMKNTELSPELSAIEGRKQASEQLSKVVDTYTADFILQNLYKLDNGNFAWKLNLSGLEANMGNIRIFPEDMHSKQFRGPVLFIGGTQSHFMKDSDMPTIKTMFPNAQLSWVDTGHLVHFERPAEFLSMVLNFLQSN